MEKSVIKEVRDCWNQKAQDWNRHIGERGDRNRMENIHKPMWDLLGNVQGLSILDAGCGTGYLTSILLKKGANVIAVDLSQEMIQIARENIKKSIPEQIGKITLNTDDCSKLETVESESVELIVSNYVLQDLPDLKGALSSFFRVLKNEGKAIVILSHPCFSNPQWVGTKENLSVNFKRSTSYYHESKETETWQGTDNETKEIINFKGEFIYFHRPLSMYFKVFKEAGFIVEELLEPVFDHTTCDDEENRKKKALLCPYSIMFKLIKS